MLPPPLSLSFCEQHLRWLNKSVLRRSCPVLWCQKNCPATIWVVGLHSHITDTFPLPRHNTLSPCGVWVLLYVPICPSHVVLQSMWGWTLLLDEEADFVFDVASDVIDVHRPCCLGNLLWSWNYQCVHWAAMLHRESAIFRKSHQ